MSYFFHLARYQRSALAGAVSYYVSLLFIFQGGFVPHLSGDLRIALAAEVGGIVNLLWMPRTLCESDHDNDVDNDYGTESDESEKTIKMIRMVKLPQ